jgi:hypothetical protein
MNENVTELICSEDIDMVNLGLTILFSGQFKRPGLIFSRNCIKKLFANHKGKRIQFLYSEPTEVQITSPFSSDKRGKKRAVTYIMFTRLDFVEVYNDEIKKTECIWRDEPCFKFTNSRIYQLHDVELFNLKNLKGIKIK